ncbi:GNAT family N-acetyltransferase [Microbacterium horticulturae]|uniref:GNAT family N-acetyltransferase n=1 Tax=Microbacterium horticulturae TaxID=3028316 RepID=A0ABY8BXF4_9MICO|nr:GNAT family N-acetyltransferase [Microbacterium sp. KACC 23027]WEG08874.1 GNAT family N-acetyltransferase [Microbacterium sp. KACC 23027]
MEVLRFRPLSARDLDEAPAWFGEIELRADEWRDVDTRSAIAVDDSGAAAAAGIIWTSRAHGDRYWIDMIVDPRRRRRGIGRAMLGHLAQLRARGIPFITRGYVDSERLNFAYACGARTIQIVPPTRVRATRAEVLRPHRAVVAAARVPFAQVLGAHADMYEWIHRGWSPVSAGFAAVVNEGLLDDLDLDASALALDDLGHVRAIAAVYLDSEPPAVCAETTRPDEAEGERLVEGCLHHALAVLADRGVTSVDLDGHVTDPHLMPNWARLAPAGEWFLLVEIPV